MATFSGNISTNVKLYLELTQVSQNVANNTSVVKAKAYVSGTGNGAWSNYTTSGKITLNGVDYPFTLASYNFSGSVNVVLKEVSVTVAHNNDGTKTVSGSVYWNPDNSAWLDAITVSGSLALTTIPRASKFTASNINAGAGNIPITLTKSPAATTHRAKVMYGTTQIAEKDIGANPTFITIADTEWTTFYNLTKTVTSGTFTITITTFNGTTNLGTDQKTITVSYASTDIPSFTSVTGAETNTAVSSVAAAYIQILSKIKFTINGAVGIKSSTITAYEIKFDTAVYGVNNPIHTANKAGTFTAYARVQDSRGRWSSAKTLSVTILSYSYPSITLFKVDRATSAGVAELLGTYAKTTFSGRVASVQVGGVQKNSIRYRVDDVTSGTVNKVGTQTVLNTSFSNVVHTFGTYPIDTVAILKMTLTDAFNQSVQYNISLSTADVPFTLGKYGVGIGGVVNNALAAVLQVFGQSSFFGKVNFLDGIQPQSVNGLNMDNITETGFYYGNTMTNAAVANISIFEVYKYSPDWIVQTQYVPNSAGGAVYIRSRHSGTTWSPWKEIQTIVESGTNSNGTYVKYADGTMECYMSRVDTAVPITTALSGWYRNDTLAPCVYPANFVVTPSVTFSANGSLFMGYATIYSIGAGSIILRLINPTSITSDISTRYIAKGRWK